MNFGFSSYLYVLAKSFLMSVIIIYYNNFLKYYMSPVHNNIIQKCKLHILLKDQRVQST